MVYGTFVLFFDVLMIPILIDSTSLQYGQDHCVGDGVVRDLLDSRVASLVMVFQGVFVWADGYVT